MALINLLQTDFGSGSAGAACSGRSVTAGVSISKEMTTAGPSGTTEVIPEFINSESLVVGVEFFSGQIGVTSWAAGNYTWRLNITTTSSAITLEEVHICRVNTSGVSQESLGSVTGLGQSLGSAGTLSGTISGSAATALTTDKVYVTYVFSNSSTHGGDDSFGFTPNQTINTPIDDAVDVAFTTTTPPALVVSEQLAEVNAEFEFTTNTPDALVVTPFLATVETTQNTEFTTNTPDALIVTEQLAEVNAEIAFTTNTPDTLIITTLQATVTLVENVAFTTNAPQALVLTTNVCDVFLDTGADYSPNSVDFDGTNDYMLTSGTHTGNADSKVGIVSMWVRRDTDGGVNYLLTSADSTAYNISFNGVNQYQIRGRNAADTEILRILTAFPLDNAWHHLVSSWDLANSYAETYLDDVLTQFTPLKTNDTVDLTHGQHSVGSTTLGAQKFNGCLADVYVNFKETIDLSVTANRRKFIDASGNPVRLGTRGILPTGSTPLILLTDPGATFGNNEGDGDDYTITGSITACSDGPVADVEITTNTDALIITTYQTSIAITVSVSVLTGTDDSEERLDTNASLTTSTDLELINDPSVGGDQVVGIRFAAPGIPQGAVIESAFIQFYQRYNDTGATSLTLRGHDIDDSPTFDSSVADISNRGNTTASVNWNSIANWSVDTLNDDSKTPDLKTIVQEIVDRPSFGGPITFKVTGSGERTAYSYDEGTGKEPVLTVSFAPVSDVNVVTKTQALVIITQTAVVNIEVSFTTNAPDALVLSEKLATVQADINTNITTNLDTLVVTTFDADVFQQVFYAAEAVTFDGANDWVVRTTDLVGNADGSKGTVSLWFKFDTTPGASDTLFSIDSDVLVKVAATGKIYVRCRDTSNNDLVLMTATAVSTGDSTWHHLIASWDTTNGAPLGAMYIDDVDQTDVTVTGSAVLIDYTSSLIILGAQTNAGANTIAMCMSEFYFNNSEYLDLDVESNRRKFVYSDITPVNLGADGSTPTTNQPIIYLNGDNLSFNTNQGDGGNFTLNTTIDNCADTPSGANTDITTNLLVLNLVEQQATAIQNIKTDITTNAPDALVITDYLADISLNVSFTTNVDSLIVTAYSQDINEDTSFTTVLDALVLTNLPADINAAIVLDTNLDSLVLTEFQATVVAGENTDITTNLDSLILTEQTSEVNAAISFTTNLDALIVTDYLTDINLDYSVTTNLDSLILTELLATVNLSIDVSTNLDTLVITTFNAGIAADNNVAITTNLDALILTPYIVTVNASIDFTTNLDSLIVTTFNQDINLNKTITTNLDPLVVTTYLADSNLDYSVTTNLDSLVLTELLSDVTVDIHVATVLDALSLTTFNAGVEADNNVNISANADALILTEYPTTLNIATNIDTVLDAVVLATQQASVVSTALYLPEAVDFDGTNDWLNRGAVLTSVTDTKKGIASFWVRYDNTSNHARLLEQAGAKGLNIVHLSTNGYTTLTVNSAASATVMQVQANINIGTSDGWTHFLFSWDSGTGDIEVYVDDVLRSANKTIANTDDIGYASATDTYIGRRSGSASQKLHGCLSDFYVNTDEYLDLTVTANRRKFITSDLKPVDPGADGSLPTGNQPTIFLSGDNAAFDDNLGYGGTFTTTGALVDCSDSPGSSPIQFTTATDALVITPLLTEINASTNVAATLDPISLTTYAATVAVPYIFKSAYFDGTNDSLDKLSDLDSNVDGQQGLVSFWYKFDNTTSRMDYYSGQGYCEIQRTSDNRLQVFLRNSSFSIITTTTFRTFAGEAGAVDTWHHCCISWDTSVTTANINKIAIDGVVKGQSTNVISTPDFTRIRHFVGAGNGGYSFRTAGCLAEFYLNNNTSGLFDVNLSSVREKFRDLSGNPVDLGSDGSIPTGSQPIIYLNGDETNIQTNQGFGGDFIVTGALTACLDSVEFTTNLTTLTLTEYPASNVNFVIPVNTNLDVLALTIYPSVVNSSTNITTNLSALNLIEYSADINLNVSISTNIDSLVLTELASTINSSTNISTQVDQLTVTTFVADTSAAVDITTNVATLTLTTFNVGVVFNTDISVITDSFALTTYAANVIVNYSININCNFNSLFLYEYSYGFSRNINVDTIQQNLIFTTNTFDLNENIRINCIPKSLVLTENTAAINYSIGITTNVTNLVTTAFTADINLDYSVNSNLENFILTEFAASINAETSITTIVDSLNITENISVINAVIDFTTNTDTLVITTYPTTVNLIVDITSNILNLNIITNKVIVNVPIDIITNVAGTYVVTTYQAAINTIGSGSIYASNEALSLITHAATTNAIIDLNVNAPSNLIVTTYSANIDLNYSVNTNVASLVFTELLADINNNVAFTSIVDALTLTTFSCDINAQTNFTASIHNLSLTTFVFDSNENVTITSGITNLSLVEHSCEIGVGTVINTVLDTLSITAFVADINKDISILTLPGLLNLTTLPFDINENLQITTVTETFTLITNKANVNYAVNIDQLTPVLFLNTHDFIYSYDQSIDTLVTNLNLNTHVSNVNKELNITTNLVITNLVNKTANINAGKVLTTNLDILNFNTYQAAINTTVGEIEAVGPNLTLTTYKSDINAVIKINVSNPEQLTLITNLSEIAYNVKTNIPTNNNASLSLNEYNCVVGISTNLSTNTDILIFNSYNADAIFTPSNFVLYIPTNIHTLSSPQVELKGIGGINGGDFEYVGTPLNRTIYIGEDDRIHLILKEA